MSNKSNKSINSPDVLIVGGGMSGLFAAWRLLKTTPGRNVTVVEKMGQVGGRLETTFVDIIGNDGVCHTVHDEEGGMRFVPEGSGMEHLWNLINALNKEFPVPLLNPVDFVMGDDNNRYYTRGRSFTLGESKANNYQIWSEVFTLGPNEQGKKPSDILQEVMDDILKQNGMTKNPSSPAAWANFRNNCTYKDFEGCPVCINKWGFWSILRNYGMTEECIEMLSHIMGFMGPFQDFINAGEGLQILFDFPDPKTTHFKTLGDGFQSLPNTLAKSIEGAGGTIILNETITSITEIGGVFTATGVQQSYTAPQVILAIPKKPMKELAKTTDLLATNAEFMRAVNSVQNMELTKVGLYFKERWWHENPSINLTNGPNFTDLPLGSVYTFSQYPADPEHDKTYNGPAALTQYTDYIRGNFWKEMQNIGEMYQTEDFPQNPAGTAPASKALVHEMMKQIKLLFGVDENTEIPDPVLSTYRVWGQAPYGFGYHQYKINVNDLTDVYPTIYSPATNLFVCNESWSPEQGWVEGALIMSDYVMQKGFRLPAFADDSFAQSI
ncbi:flavin monoamine oxidase family protein [Algoriphagus aquimarinus]|uniref:Tryptophan 2-monooxygenase n=1 Tax=Algoriphagus aquimarinus TaxID=237018 RepID=A0A5C7B859_9BACT|nr:FAD-dependent oxidoreductase [Algoriphagus aquimarinus]TXE14745.1 FAD-dependent oxidoreductase [Algoriphagus aquimarinus]